MEDLHRSTGATQEKYEVLDNADYTAPIRQHELEHGTDQEFIRIFSERSVSLAGEIIIQIIRRMLCFLPIGYEGSGSELDIVGGHTPGTVKMEIKSQQCLYQQHTSNNTANIRPNIYHHRHQYQNHHHPQRQQQQ